MARGVRGVGCKVKGCPCPWYCKDWCNKHYLRARRYGGDPLGGGPFRIASGVALAYFFEHVDDVTVRCLDWPYSVDQGGYGVVQLDGRQQKIHALACERRHGPKPHPEMIAIHLPVVCHNRSCFNGRHLRWGTVRQNFDDMVLDGTNPAGERHPLAKLTWKKVGQIRAQYAAGGVTQLAIAAQYGVSKSTISHIITRRKWKTDPPSGSAPQQEGSA